MAGAGRSLPDVALTRMAIDRRSELRDPDLLPRLLADDATRVFRLHGTTARVRESGDDSVRLVLDGPRPEDADRLAVYLGEADGAAHVGVVHPARDEPEPDDRTLREAGALLDDLGASLFATTQALANWHGTHGHCPRCGAPTEAAHAGWIRTCPADGSDHYPRTDMAVIMAVVDDADRILLARNRSFRGRGMSVLAGFVEPGETLAAAVEREVGEEVGVGVTDVTYLGDQPWPFPASLMLGFRARALGTDLRLQEDEIAAARWFTRDELVAAVADESVVVPGRVSIARRLIEHWFGGPLDAPEIPIR